MVKNPNHLFKRKKNLNPKAIKKNGNAPLKISVTDYDENQICTHDHVSALECLKFLETPLTTWINIRGINNPSEIQSVGQQFNLHPLLIEDILTINQRPKVDDYGNHLFIIMQSLKFSDMQQGIENEQVSFVLGKDYVISFQESEGDLFAPIRHALEQNNHRLRTFGADYLCYALMDNLIDQYFSIVEKVDENLDHLEDELVHDPKPLTILKIQRCKREITFVRKSVWPLREVISKIFRLETPLIQARTKVWLNDVYDHTIQVIEGVEIFREVSSGLIDIYLSNINLRMNEVMKVLTVVSTIFVPLTFVASIYGMNFDYIPELHWKYGYPYVLSIMFVMAMAMLTYFRRKNWI